MSTTYPAQVRLDGRWWPVSGQLMDSALVVLPCSNGVEAAARVQCRLLRDLLVGERGSWVWRACAASGARCPGKDGRASSPSWLPASPASGGWSWWWSRWPGIGTSLGDDLQQGLAVHGGRRHHLKAINTIRRCGGLAAAVEQGVLRAGIIHACVSRGVPFVLAGSIHDDGPLPDTEIDLIAAQAASAVAPRGAEMVIMLASMLHSISAGIMIPGGVKLVCVDLNPAGSPSSATGDAGVGGDGHRCGALPEPAGGSA